MRKKTQVETTVRLSRGHATALATLGMAGALSLSTAQQADARGRIPVIQQITNNTVGTISDPRIRSQFGDSIVFTSDGDVTGLPPGHNEIYYFDVLTGTMTRLTNTVVGESREGARATDSVGAGERPEQITFVSTGNLDPSVGNADGNPEIFVWRKDNNTMHQLTNTPVGVVNSDPYPSDSSKCIVFSSTGNLNNNPGTDPTVPTSPHSNLDGSVEVFQYTVEDSGTFPSSGFFTQLSNGPVGTTSTRPVVGGYIFQRQCQTSIYMSTHDQTGEGINVGNTNIFEYDRNSGNTLMLESGEVPWDIQPGNYLYPHISSASPFARGPFVVFQTDADEWRNGSDGSEIFRFRAFHPRMTQYTDYLDGSVERPVISDGGGYIAFQSNGEILDVRHDARLGGTPPFNVDGNYEIFKTKGRTKVWQITNSEGCTNDLPSVRDDATSIAFRSDCDLVPGSNAGGVQQVFLYQLVKSRDVLATEAGCEVDAGCCNEANGCYQQIYGGKPKPRKKGCLDKSGCRDLFQ